MDKAIYTWLLDLEQNVKEHEKDREILIGFSH
jgi:hypothetical protein